jgi:putative PIN family toxin of toxin-antitoxin system
VIRAVLDPNVLISAFIGRRGSSPDRIVRAWRDGAFELVVSPTLLAELSTVLARPKFARRAAGDRASAYVRTLAAGASRPDDPVQRAALSPDPGDDYLIALARAASADVIVSGDRHLTGLVSPRPPVLTPRQFLERLREL